jgi:rhamnosyltransferase
MASITLFASYVNGIGLPYYTEVYLSELKKYSDRLIYIYSNELNQEAFDFFDAINIEIVKVQNEGFDFGQWQKVLKVVDLNTYDQLFLVNDSSVLFKSLDVVFKWFNHSSIDFGGLTESLFPKKHIQSYFLLFNKSTFNDLEYYFNNTNATNDIHQVITDFEIGLSQYLIFKNFSCQAFLNNNDYRGEYAPYYQCLSSHINQGSPLIKKKVLFSSYRTSELFTLARMNFNINVNEYVKLILKKNTELLISFPKLLSSQKNELSALLVLKYNLTCILIQIYRKFIRAK